MPEKITESKSALITPAQLSFLNGSHIACMLNLKNVKKQFHEHNLKCKDHPRTNHFGRKFLEQFADQTP